MKRFLFVTSLLVVVLVVFASMASATVTNVASWRGGENDVNPGPTGVFGAADAIAVDGTGNGHDLTNSGINAFYAYPGDYSASVGLPSYNALYSPSGALSSTVDYAWAAGTGAFTGPVVDAGTENWGYQCWVRPNELGTMTFLGNGNGGQDISLFSIDVGAAFGEGYGTGVQYCAEITEKGALYLGGAVDITKWHNLGLVNDAGTVSLYIDGVVKSSSVVGSVAAAGSATSMVLGGSMAGGIDEARIFTFAPGAFQVSDLGVATPEPGTMVLLSTGLVGLLAYAWRKRKQL
jgi:hypothetical protein